jgi:hypothetical protein
MRSHTLQLIASLVLLLSSALPPVDRTPNTFLSFSISRTRGGYLMKRWEAVSHS